MGDFAKDINSKFESEQQKAMLNLMFTANWMSGIQNDFFKTFSLISLQ